MIRVASGQGYWGDWPQAPALQVNSGPIDYMVMDYLAEVTMSIMHKQKAKNPETAGYATDFVNDMAPLLPKIAERNIKVIASAGGVNPRACARALLAKAEAAGVRGLKVGIVEGDDILGRLKGEGSAPPLAQMDKSGPKLGEILPKMTSANVYLGARPVAEALAKGAQIVVTGRCTDTGLTLGAMIHEFKIAEDDWDALALGTVIGHILECGAQASGGNFQGDWRSIPHPEKIGFPIAEIHGRDRAVITKHKSLGGKVSPAVVKEQLLYEIGDPRSYLTPDCVADFTSIQLKELGKDRVEVAGVRGRPKPPTLKVSCVYEAGWKVTGQITYCWPEAKEKALFAGNLIRRRVERLIGKGKIDEWRIEAVGADACFGALVAGSPEPSEVTLRISARSQDRAACDAIGRELVPMVLTGPPGATGFAGGRPRASEVAAFWSGLISSDLVTPVAEVLAS